MKKVGVVLVNYKEYANRFLSDCRDSLRVQKDIDFRVYIVDNASSDASLTYLKSNYPEAEILVRADGNYAAANNLGAKRAIEDGCDYIFILNMDTVLDANCLSQLVTSLEECPQAFIAQAKILLHDKGLSGGNEVLNSLGNVIHFLGFGFTRGYGRPEQDFANFLASDKYPEIKGYASGCALLISRIAWQIIGGYDEIYYMYHDDLELGVKARLAGGKIILAPDALVYHKYEFARSVKMLYYMERNRRLFVLSFYPASLIVLLLPALIVMEIGMLFYALLKGWSLTLFQIWGYFFRFSTWRKILACRRKIKNLAKLPFADLADDFAGKIDFQEINNPVLRYLANPILSLYWRLCRFFL